ncbi:hypothetical protein TcYC6_0064530 [Trypanosoma cruzi]|nr:hypothetical protein TcYC6_0064530 [Trypanosoma cruzi]
MRLNNPFLTQRDEVEMGGENGNRRSLQENLERCLHSEGGDELPVDEEDEDDGGDESNDDCPTPPYVPCRYQFGLSAAAFVIRLD